MEISEIYELDYDDLTDGYIALQAEVERLRGLLREVLTSGVTHEDQRIRYKEMQIDVGLLEEIKKVLPPSGEGGE